jgi:hypothetical protein
MPLLMFKREEKVRLEGLMEWIEIRPLFGRTA